LHGIGRGPWGHDLVGLVRALADAGAEVSDAGAEAALRLSRHYIPARYPDTHPSGSAADRYGAGDAAKAVEDAELILKLVDSGWEELGA
jgi:HEPN domain-containing protein